MPAATAAAEGAPAVIALPAIALERVVQAAALARLASCMPGHCNAGTLSEDTTISSKSSYQRTLIGFMCMPSRRCWSSAGMANLTHWVHAQSNQTTRQTGAILALAELAFSLAQHIHKHADTCGLKAQEIKFFLINSLKMSVPSIYTPMVFANRLRTWSARYCSSSRRTGRCAGSAPASTARPRGSVRLGPGLGLRVMHLHHTRCRLESRSLSTAGACGAASCIQLQDNKEHDHVTLTL